MVKDRFSVGGPWGDAFRELADTVLAGSLIVLLGKRGTGKTQLAVALAANMCDDRKRVRYLKMMDLFREIRTCYRPGGPNEVKVVDGFCDIFGLILDEAHEASDSEWENRTFTNIIDRRYDGKKTTILVSNFDRQQFAEQVGASVVSRIHETGRVVVCDWPSFRTGAAK